MSDPNPALQAAQAYFVAVSHGDLAEIVSLFDANAHLEDPVGTPALTGHEGVGRFVKGLRRAWSELRMTPTLVCTRDNTAAVAWQAAGRSATGKDIQFAGIDILAVNDAGLITRVEGYWDIEAVIAQM